MSIVIEEGEQDDFDFIGLVQNLVLNLIEEHSPDEAFAVCIDNWFDHKWLKFSGKGVVKFPVRGVGSPDTCGLEIESALSEFYQDKITFPPFSPNRILKQQYFKRRGVDVKDYIHRDLKESSSTNLQRRITQYSQSGVFVWYSSKTKINDRGSMMVYTVKGEQWTTWYASFLKKEVWKLDRVKGYDR